MSTNLKGSPADRLPLGIRQSGERRYGDRRQSNRPTRDRRQRRRRKVRSLVFSALAVVMPSQLKPLGMKTLLLPPMASVAVTITRFDPVPPRAAYEPFIREAGLAYDIDPGLIRSVIEVESAFDANAVSRTGAAGLMQLMPETAESLGVEDRFDPRENIMGGTRLLRELHDQYRGELPLVLAGYNAGTRAVARFGRIPPFRETQDYVIRVTQLFRANRDTESD